MNVRVSEIVESASLWGFSPETNAAGRVWWLQAFAADPVIGLMRVCAGSLDDERGHVNVTCNAGGKVIEVRVSPVRMCLTHHSTFSRQFNLTIRPAVITELARRGLYPTRGIVKPRVGGRADQGGSAYAPRTRGVGS